MKKTVIISACFLLIAMVILGVKIKTSEARINNLDGCYIPWSELKKCFDADPGNDYPCCQHIVDEIEQPQ